MSETKPGADIVADAREWLARYGGRETTHSDGCHRWHDACLIARLVAECESRTGSIDAKAGAEATERHAQGANAPERERLESRLEELRTAADLADAECRDEIARLRLTATERESLGYYIGTGGPDGVDATIRALLERLKDTPAALDTPSKGSVHNECALTDEEREAVEWASKTLCVGWHDLAAGDKQRTRDAAATLRGLLERTK